MKMDNTPLLTNQKLVKLELSEDITNRTYIDCYFEKVLFICQLSRIRFENCSFKNCRFTQMENVQFKLCLIEQCNGSHISTVVTDVHMTDCMVDNFLFDNCKIKNLKIEKCSKLSKGKKELKISQFRFNFCNVDNIEVITCILRDLYISDSTMKNMTIRNCRGNDSPIYIEKSTLDNIRVESNDIPNTIIMQTSITNGVILNNRLNLSVIKNTDVVNTDITRTKIYNSNLEGSKFLFSDLSKVDMSLCNLTFAKFENVTVMDSKLLNADMSNSKLDDVRFYNVVDENCKMCNTKTKSFTKNNSSILRGSIHFIEGTETKVDVSMVFYDFDDEIIKVKPYKNVTLDPGEVSSKSRGNENVKLDFAISRGITKQCKRIQVDIIPYGIMNFIPLSLRTDPLTYVAYITIGDSYYFPYSDDRFTGFQYNDKRYRRSISI